jgi:hypothetical protein
MLENEKVYTLADIKKAQSPINRRNKKLEIEKRNLEASIKIQAHNKIMKNEARQDLEDLKSGVRAQLKDGVIPMDAYIEIYDGKIKNLTDKCKYYDEKKEAAGGFLTAAQENQLKIFRDALEKTEKDKAEFLIEKEAEILQAKKDKEEYLTRKKKEEKIAKERRDREDPNSEMYGMPPSAVN